MDKDRLEAFSDGVFAILITILVLDLKVPRGAAMSSLVPLWPVFISYIMSFVFLGIYWNNHHHLLYATRKVGGRVLWANLHLLFWLSLIPFTTGWVGENQFASAPTALYGAVLLMAAVAYYMLLRAILATQGRDSLLAVAVGKDVKGNLSLVIYLVAIPIAFYNRWIAGACYVAVALIWLVPDPRIEKALAAYSQSRKTPGEPDGG